MNDRIKLAEAMGWERTPCECVDAGQQWGWESPDKKLFRKADELPDPLTDANDDYAVLEWMRDQTVKFRNLFQAALQNPHAPNVWSASLYQIGDYARAALKVLRVRNDE